MLSVAGRVYFSASDLGLQVRVRNTFPQPRFIRPIIQACWLSVPKVPVPVEQ